MGCAQTKGPEFLNSAADAFVVTILYSYEPTTVADVDSGRGSLDRLIENLLPKVIRRKEGLGCSSASDPKPQSCENLDEYESLLREVMNEETWAVKEPPNDTATGGPPSTDAGGALVEPRLQQELSRLLVIKAPGEDDDELLAEAAARVRTEAANLQTLIDSYADSEIPPSRECPKSLSQSQVCTYSFTLEAGSRKTLAGDLWERLVRHSDGVLTFAVEFFDGRTSPSNARGYLQVKPTAAEPASKRSVRLTGAVSLAEEPQLDSDPSDSVKEVFSPPEPYLGGELDHAPALVRLHVTQTLGNRASASLVTELKKGALGEQDQSGTVKAVQYEANLYGLQGTALRFGRSDFAKPASGVAISESGEGMTFIFRSFSLSRIFKRESLRGFSDAEDRDSEAWLAQLRGLPLQNSPFGGLGLLRHVDLFVLFGEQRDENRRPYDYRTYGAEAFFGLNEIVSDEGWSGFGSVAIFDSKREMDGKFLPPSSSTDEPFQEVTDASGTSLLLEVNFTRVEKPDKDGDTAKKNRIVSLRYGRATGDDAETADCDEGYLGETASFAPDSLFLARFSGRLAWLYTDSAGQAVTVVVPRGLANKEYWGLAWTEVEQAKKFSPLYALATAFGAKSDVQSQSFTLRLHQYRFVEPVLDKKGAGWEVGLEWLLEAPKGVKYTLGVGRYFPEGATTSFFTEDPTFFTLGVNATLQ